MRYSLNTADFLRGLAVAVGTAVLVLLQQMISTSPVVINWGQLGIAASSAAVAYLLKNFLTDDVLKAKSTLKQAATSVTEARKVENIETKK
jgi:hypothetical protein